ncbi:MAG: alpha/beta hydrolase family protein [Rubrivivax sp.]
MFHTTTAANRHHPLRRLAAWARTLPLAASALFSATAAQAQVGFTELKLDGLDQSVTLVYPTAQASRPVAMGPFTLDVAVGAAPSPGPHRLVVLSHGTAGSPLPDHQLAATLARAGFVVAQPLHAGDNFADHRRAGPEAFATRPLEVTRTLDALARHPQWAGLLKLDRVGVHGMSAGGVTALSLAGARWSVGRLVQHCNTQDDLGFCYNGLPTLQAQAARRASFEAAKGLAEAQWPEALKAEHGGRPAGETDPRPDARIAAVSVAVPVAAIFSTDSLAAVRVPVGVVSAGADTMLPATWHSGHVLKACSACRPLAHLPQASHFDLLGPWPEGLARSVGAVHPRGGQLNPGFPAAERQQAWDAVASFMQQQLR